MIMEENKQDLEQQDPNQQNDSKDEKKYQTSLRLMMGLLSDGGKELLKKNKATDDQLDKVVNKLLEEKSKKFEEQLEKDVSTLIDLHLKAEDEIAKKEKEIEQAKKNIKKEFTNSAMKIINQVANQNSLFERYKKTLAGRKEQEDAPLTNQDPS